MNKSARTLSAESAMYGLAKEMTRISEMSLLTASNDSEFLDRELDYNLTVLAGTRSFVPEFVYLELNSLTALERS